MRRLLKCIAAIALIAWVGPTAALASALADAAQAGPGDVGENRPDVQAKLGDSDAPLPQPAPAERPSLGPPTTLGPLPPPAQLAIPEEAPAAIFDRTEPPVGRLLLSIPLISF